MVKNICNIKSISNSSSFFSYFLLQKITSFLLTVVTLYLVGEHLIIYALHLILELIEKLLMKETFYFNIYLRNFVCLHNKSSAFFCEIDTLRCRPYFHSFFMTKLTYVNFEKYYAPPDNCNDVVL